VGEARRRDIGGTSRYLDFLASRYLEVEGYKEVAAPSCQVA